MKSFLHGAMLGLVALAAAASAGQQSLVPAHSEITFTSTQMGVPMHGKFADFGADVALDSKRVDSSRIAFTIELGSVSLDAAEMAAELAKPVWFDTRRFPQATFRSVAVKPLGEGRLEVAGKLTIKGQVRDVVVPVTTATTAAGTTATGAFVIKRLDFGIGDGEWKDVAMVGNDVHIRFKLVLTETAPI